MNNFVHTSFTVISNIRLFFGPDAIRRELERQMEEADDGAESAICTSC